jgi:hypothetical protein
MFVKLNQSGVAVWTGTPDCQAAHDQLLAALNIANTIFLPVGTALTSHRKGSLGEFIALTVGHVNDLANCRVIAANADNPLSNISRPDLDLLWLFFGATPSEDFGIVQEVKTTEDSGLNYADRLIEDYAKLFDTDPQFTLQSRFGVAANKMEHMRLGVDLCCRTRELGGISPDTSPGVRLVPTLVHERKGARPVPKLIAVKSTIVASEGWRSSSVECWSIALEGLHNRLARLTWGQH